MEGSPREGVHFQYNVDLSKPSAEALERIRSDLVEKITANVAQELKEMEGADPDIWASRDRHYSIHSRD